MKDTELYTEEEFKKPSKDLEEKMRVFKKSETSTEQEIIEIIKDRAKDSNRELIGYEELERRVYADE